MSERYASGEIYVEVNDREAIASLRRIDAEFEKAMHKIDAQEAEITIGADLDRLKRDLKEAEARVKEFEKKKADASTTSDRRSAAATAAAARKKQQALENEIKGVEGVTDALRKENKQLDFTNQRLAQIAKREESIERTRDKAAKAEARRAKQRIDNLTSEGQRRAGLERQRVREASDDERAAWRMEREKREVPKLERQYAMLHDRLEKLARAKKKVRGDDHATFIIDVQEREALSKIQNIREEVNRRVGRDPVYIDVTPRFSQRAGERLRHEFIKSGGQMSAVAATLGVDVGNRMGHGAVTGFRRTMDRGIGSTIAGVTRSVSGGIARGGIAALGKVAHAAGGLADATVRLGPFTATLRQAFIGLSLLAPILVDVLGAVGALGAVTASAAVGVTALGIGFMGGLVPAAIAAVTVIKPVINEFGTAMKASQAYAKAVREHGKGSDEAAKKQKILTNVLRDTDDRTRAIITSAGGMKDAWEKATAPARASSFRVMGEGLKFLSDNVGFFGAKTNTTFKNAEGSITRWFRRLNSKGGKDALGAMWDNFNEALPSILDGLGNIGAYLGKIGQLASARIPGIAATFERWSERVLGTADNMDALDGRIGKVIQSAKDVGNFFLAAGRLMKAFFSGGVDAGQGFARTMTDAMNGWTASLNTVGGQSKLNSFFKEAVAGTQALYGTLQPVIASFVRWAAIISPWARLFFNAAAGVAEFVSSFLRITGLTTPLAGLVTTLGALWAVGKISAGARAIAAFTTGLLGMSRANAAVASTAAASTAAMSAQAAAAARGAAVTRGASAVSAGGVLLPAGTAARAAGTATQVTKMGRAATVARGAMTGLGAATIGVASPIAGLAAVTVAAGVGMYVWANRTRDWQKSQATATKHAQQFRAIASQLGGANMQLAQQTVSLSQATMDQKNVTRQAASEEKELNRLRSDGKRGTEEYTALNQQHKQTLLQVQSANLAVIQSEQQRRASIDAIKAAEKEAVNQAIHSRDEAKKTVDSLGKNGTSKFVDKMAASARAAKMPLEDYINLRDKEGTLPYPKERLLEYVAAQGVLAASLKRVTEAQQLQYMSSLNTQRALKGLPAIASTAAKAFSEVAKLGGKSLSSKISLKFEDPGQAARVAKATSSALKSGLPSKVAFKIVADAKDARSAINELNRRRVTDKRMKIIESGGRAAVRMVEQLSGKKVSDKSAKIIMRGGPAAIAEFARLNGYPLPKKWQDIGQKGASGVMGWLIGLLRVLLPPKKQTVTKNDLVTGFLNSLRNIRLPDIIQRVVTKKVKYAGGFVGGFASGGNAEMTTDRDTQMLDRAFADADRNGRESQRGGSFSRPTYIVGEENRREWVIATNPAYKQANIAYWQQAGRDLGVPGFAAGGEAGYHASLDPPKAGPGNVPGFYRQPKKGKKKKKKWATQRASASTAGKAWRSHLAGLDQRQEELEREVSIRESQVKEPTDLIMEDPSGERIKVKDEYGKEIDGGPKMVANTPAIDLYKDQVDSVLTAQTALRSVIEQLFNDLPKALGQFKNEEGWRKSNRSTLEKEISRDEAIEGSSKKSKDAKKAATARLKKNRARLENEEAALSDIKSFKDNYDDAYSDAGFDLREADIRIAELNADKSDMDKRGTTDAASANTSTSGGGGSGGGSGGGGSGGTDDPFASQRGNLSRLDAEGALAAIGQSLSGGAPRTQDQINTDRATAQQSIIDQARGMLSDTNPSNDQVAIDAITQAGGALADLNGGVTSLVGQMQTLSSARGDLLRSFGGNFALAGVFGAGAGATSGLGGPLGVAGGGVGFGGGQSVVNQNITNNFTQQPDPHTWSQGIAWELQAAL